MLSGSVLLKTLVGHWALVTGEIGTIMPLSYIRPCFSASDVLNEREFASAFSMMVYDMPLDLSDFPGQLYLPLVLKYTLLVKQF